jgi:antitoxin (DNA-binding transcriptional repressor) of toxin-antitoxin stability system
VKIESVRVVRNRLSEMIKSLPAGPVIITRNGSPCAALVGLGEHTDLEAFLVAHNPRLTALIERGMSEPGGIPLAQVEREVSRRTRRKKPREK